MFRSYWSAIASGNYSAAYKTYYPGYVNQPSGQTESDFVSQENTYRPQVAMDSLETSPRDTHGNVATLNASILTRDRGGSDAGQCKLWSGWVQFIHLSSGWRYYPGDHGWGTPSFNFVPSNDPSCP